ncbi:hypothetical protein [Kiloniella laminariae]|uniref:hypothetical protein n=1 Tax=Kiloniella laminariae TaxID=454162 RepID=UPI0003716F98|nr:hypothetical protein [Kiloniella laminariae]
MSFSEYLPEGSQFSTCSEDGVALYSQITSSGKALYVFSFGRQLVDELGLEEGSKLRLSWGEGEDKGYLRVIPDQKKGWQLKAQAKSRFYRIHVNNYPRELKNKKLSQLRLEHTIDEKGELLLVLPKGHFGRGALQ